MALPLRSPGSPPNPAGSAGTVWLYGDAQSCPGLLGFLTSARKEYKGDRLRAVFSCAASTGEVDFDVLVESARKLDLVVNCFDSTGRCGIFAPKKTQVKHLPSPGNSSYLGEVGCKSWVDDCSQLISCTHYQRIEWIFPTCFCRIICQKEMLVGSSFPCHAPSLEMSPCPGPAIKSC